MNQMIGFLWTLYVNAQELIIIDPLYGYRNRLTQMSWITVFITPITTYVKSVSFMEISGTNLS